MTSSSNPGKVIAGNGEYAFRIPPMPDAKQNRLGFLMSFPFHSYNIGLLLLVPDKLGKTAGSCIGSAFLLFLPHEKCKPSKIDRWNW